MTRLLALTVGLGAFTLLATAVGVARRLPYQFGGNGSPDDVASDALMHGTGVSAPIVFVVVMIALAYVAGRPSRVGVGAALVLAALGVVGIVAGLMEPGLRQLDPLVTSVALVGIVLAVLVVVTALGSVLGSRKIAAATA